MTGPRIGRMADRGAPKSGLRSATLAVAFALFLAAPGFASFHFMQIEKVVGGVNGDSAAQAVQLRTRAPSQDQLNRGKLIAVDAQGENPVVVVDFDDNVQNEDAGATILIASAGMQAYTDPPIVEDFAIESLIPESYLAAGSLIFENDGETLVVWRLSWGGASYSGSTLGALTNDDDREFGPPFDGTLPMASLQVLEFTGDFSATSTSNDADYALSAAAGILTNNSGDSFTLIVPNCDDPAGPGPDSDGDLVRDACDECPDDATKSEPGVCGCGLSDVDSDNDGTSDCHDPDQGGVPPDNGNDNDNENQNNNSNTNENENENENANDNVVDGNANENDNGDGTPPGNENDNGDEAGAGSGPRPCSMGVGALFLSMLGLMALRLSRSPRDAAVTPKS